MKRYKRIVIKVGTKVITSQDRSIDRKMVSQIASQIADLKDRHIEVILVTSGAIGAGLWLLRMKKRPAKLSELQATAAIGQGRLIHLYSEYLKKRGYLVGQILLTQEDFNDRSRYLNIRHTISALLQHNAVPIINENDTVAVDEIRCGDNDRLSSLVADLCVAEKLIILTDVDGLLDEDGSLISSVRKITPKILKLAEKRRCDLGTGGMITKIESARAAVQAGIECVIANGRKRKVILKIADGGVVGTAFRSEKIKATARKRWIAFSSRPVGAITIDDGAKEAVSKKDKSLLASGILSVEGNFAPGDVIKVLDISNKEIGRGIVSYSSKDLSRIKGLKTEHFKGILGFKGRDEVIHKDDLVIL